MKKAAFYLGVIIVLFFSGCKKEEAPFVFDSNMAEYERINQFIVEGVQTYYLWEAETNWEEYDNRETFASFTDSRNLFKRLIYKDDYWSTLTSDIGGMESQFEGVSTTFGYTLRFYKLSSQGNTVIAVVLFTSSNSPAAKADLKRGDIIIEMNGGDITTDNYLDLYYQPSLRIRRGELVDELIDGKEVKVIRPLQGIISITALEMYENPINTYKIIEKEGRKIGYLCYTGYQRESESELIELFSQFKSNGVQDVVLDLRYNLGGFSRTAQLLSSILAPESAVKSKSVYLEHHYNAMLTAYYKENKYELSENFVDTLPVNMNLNRLYVLTGENTASASEATMVGLEPYLDLIQIGETTSGKYCGRILLSPEDLYGEKNRDFYESFSNWGMYIMIYRFANIKGITSFTGGLAPNIQAEEDDFDLRPFGDEDDPLLGRALAHIAGIPYIERRAAKVSVPFIALPDPKKPVDGKMIVTEPLLKIKPPSVFR